MEDVPARNFLRGLGRVFSNAKGVLCISAHWETAYPMVDAVEMPSTIHDFYGFPEQLYEIEYPAHGSPRLAERVAGLLRSSDIQCDIDCKRGLDHGTWVPMKLMFPRAEIPVVQLTIQHHLDPAQHLALGRAIQDMRKEGILVMGSGGAVHPLGYEPLRRDAAPDEWAIEFEAWLTKTVTEGDEKKLLRYRSEAPYPERAHPRPDHLMPLFVAMGAAGAKARGKVLHQSWDLGDLGMGAYAFSGD